MYEIKWYENLRRAFLATKIKCPPYSKRWYLQSWWNGPLLEGAAGQGLCFRNRQGQRCKFAKGGPFSKRLRHVTTTHPIEKSKKWRKIVLVTCLFVQCLFSDPYYSLGHRDMICFHHPVLHIAKNRIKNGYFASKSRKNFIFINRQLSPDPFKSVNWP